MHRRKRVGMDVSIITIIENNVRRKGLRAYTFDSALLRDRIDNVEHYLDIRDTRSSIHGSDLFVLPICQSDDFDKRDNKSRIFQRKNIHF